MNASAPSTIDSKQYDRYALNLRIEDGMVETQPAHSNS